MALRVTNHIIMNNANTNINATKVAVDKRNTQMTTQKKINRPSEDPVVAVRGLRLQTSLNKIDQYYEKNIPDAEKWMDVTSSALSNMEKLMVDMRTLANQGANGTLNNSDRNTILSQLKTLQQQIYHEGNADYAGRTVFTGFRTDKNLIFQEDETDTTYKIKQKLSGSDLVESRFYSGEVTVPKTADSIAATSTIPDIKESIYDRLRFPYDDIGSVDGLSLSFPGGTDKNGKSQTAAVYKLDGNGNKIEKLPKTDPPVYETELVTVGTALTPDTKTKMPATIMSLVDGTKSSLTYQKYTLTTADPVTDKNAIPMSDTATTQAVEIAGQKTAQKGTLKNMYTKDGNASMKEDTNVYVFDNEDDWLTWSLGQKQLQSDGKTEVNKDNMKKYVGNYDMVIIKETGDIIFGDKIGEEMKRDSTTVTMDYTKTGFNSGELRPEYYYDCTMTQDRGTTLSDPIYYQKYNEDGSTKYYDINYTVSANQELAVNLEASDVFDSDIIQDINDMLSSVNSAISAHQKVDDIKAMMTQERYADADSQAQLQKWLDAATKEADYADDNLDKLYTTVLGNCDKYDNEINLAVTKLGCKGDQLKMINLRMSEQQETVESLQSSNDDLDLSDIILKYMAAYTAYQSSLQAAGKLGQQTLLNYI